MERYRVWDDEVHGEVAEIIEYKQGSESTMVKRSEWTSVHV